MDKYAGIEHAKGEVRNSAVIVKRRERGKAFGVICRWCIAAVLVGLIFCGKAISHPIAEKINDSVRTIVCYDMLGHDDLGAIPAIDEYETEKKES